VADRLRVPLLAITGSKDRILPLPMARRLVDRVSVRKELWIVEGAAHARCAEVAGEAYAERLASFYHGAMNPQEKFVQ
jgi:fermentation-respiration switch protein FrsA (DUF1100 family)